jgi:uncharacterized protein (DUF1330 family)
METRGGELAKQALAYLRLRLVGQEANLLRLVAIDLSGADVAAFEAYEAKALPLVCEHGGRLEIRVRSLDGQTETHLLYFPDEHAFDRYRLDPRRIAAAPEWEKSGAKSEVKLVERIDF